MSGIHLVASELDLKGSPKVFSDLIKYLKAGLEQSQTLSDLESLMQHLAEHLKIKTYSSDQKRDLKALRQKGYDRRAKLRKLSSEDLAPDLEKGQISESDLSRAIRSEESPSEVVNPPKQSEEAKMPVHEISVAKTADLRPMGQVPLVEGFKGVITNINGAQLARMLPQLVLLISASVLVAWFLWLQSVELYEASGFANPGLVSFGGILMVVGFAGFHAAYRTKLALLCCIYAGGYEAYFIASGTFSDELNSKVADKAITEKLAWHQERLDRAKMSYDRVNSRYDDPADKMHQNSWYKKKHVDSAWQVYSQAQQSMEKQQKWIQTEVANFDHTGWLKIFFRMGLVILFMLLVHRLGSNLRHAAD
ncbi:MAG: hypothetical protein AB8G05_10165 [Oligoflexales bacterium]